MSAADGVKIGFIKRRLKRVRPKRKPVLRKPTNFRNVLIVSEEDKTALIQTVNSYFDRASISVIYKRNNKEDNSKKGQYAVHLSDINLTGKVKNEKLIRLMNEQFDLIIDLQKKDDLLRYISQQIRTSFIVGPNTSENAFMYDLIIDEGQNEKEFIENIAKQITLLSTNGTK